MTPDDHQNTDHGKVRRLIWLYCIMWLIEGALRKWVLPMFSYELLLVRDPIALLIYLSASRARVFPMNGWLGYLAVVTGLIFLQAIIHVMSQNVSLAVALFGVRTFVLHMPLIWVIPAVFGRKEIALLGKWVLIIAPFLAGLMVIQFEVGPDHWLNAATLKGGGQIGSVYGKIRPAAIFSFITGPIHYFALTTAFVLAGVLIKDLYPRWLIGAGAVSVLIAMSVSASRSLVLGCFIVAAAGVAASAFSGKRMGPVVGLGIGIVIAFLFLSSFGVLKEGTNAFMDRWDSEEESGISGSKVMTVRVSGGFTSAFDWAGRVPMLGFGVGITSNLATDRGNRVIPVEGEWERVIYEVGPIAGFLYLAFRTALSVRLLVLGFGAVRSGNFLCILMGAACVPDVLYGQTKQVTTYGYMCVCAGLCIAAYKAFSGDEELPIAEQVEDIMQEKPKARGRGPFAVGGARMRS